MGPGDPCPVRVPGRLRAGALSAREQFLRDLQAVFLLLIGGFLAGVGWIYGVYLLWRSPSWSLPQKLLGTLVLPGGFVGSVLVLRLGVAGRHCSAHVCRGGQPAGVVAVLVLVALTPPLTAIHLVLRRRREPTAPAVA